MTYRRHKSISADIELVLKSQLIILAKTCTVDTLSCTYTVQITYRHKSISADIELVSYLLITHITSSLVCTGTSTCLFIGVWLYTNPSPVIFSQFHEINQKPKWLPELAKTCTVDTLLCTYTVQMTYRRLKSISADMELVLKSLSANYTHNLIPPLHRYLNMFVHWYM